MQVYNPRFAPASPVARAAKPSRSLKGRRLLLVNNRRATAQVVVPVVLEELRRAGWDVRLAEIPSGTAQDAVAAATAGADVAVVGVGD